MADAVIDWTEDPENIGGFVGRVNGIGYFNIYQMGSNYFVLQGKIPFEQGFSQSGSDPEVLKSGAVDQLGKYCAVLVSTMETMGLLPTE